MEVAPVSSNTAAAVCATLTCAAWNCVAGALQVHADLGQLRLRGGKLLAGLVVLLGDLVELRRELVDLGLDLGDGRLRGSAGARGDDDEPADGKQPGRERDAAANPGQAARQPRTHATYHAP